MTEYIFIYLKKLWKKSIQRFKPMLCWLLQSILTIKPLVVFVISFSFHYMISNIKPHFQKTINSFSFFSKRFQTLFFILSPSQSKCKRLRFSTISFHFSYDICLEKWKCMWLYRLIYIYLNVNWFFLEVVLPLRIKLYIIFLYVWIKL